MESDEKVGGRLRSARRRLRLSQSTVASHLDTTRQTIAAFEQGVRQPELRQFAKLANLYRLTFDELIGRARSAIHPEDTPPFSARFNASEELSEDDRAELSSFASYLRGRPAVLRRPFQRRPYESIAGTVKRWKDGDEAGDVLPVPIFAMLARCGIEVRFTSLDRLAGALIMLEGHTPGVLINADQPYDRQRFSAAHELGHLLLGHSTKGDGFVSLLGRRFNPVEVQADQFAVELLVPAALLDARLEELQGEDPLPHRVYRLAAVFMVSFQAMSMRLAKLGVLSPEQEASLENVKPGEVAKAIGLKPKTRTEKFKNEWLPDIASRTLPVDWQRKAGPDLVRLLQENAYSEYVARVPEELRAENAGTIYERVALWVSSISPVVEL